MTDFKHYVLRKISKNILYKFFRHEQILNFSWNSVGYGELLVRHYELWFVCRASQRCRQCIRLQPATSPQEGCNTSLSTRQFGNLSVEMRYVWREG